MEFIKALAVTSDSTSATKIEKDSPQTSDGVDSYKCKICPQKFANLQLCLKHELLEHSMHKKSPQKTMRNKLNSILKSFSEDDKQTLRSQIRLALTECSPGTELETIISFHRMNVENLELVYTRVYTCLKEELESIGKFKIFPFGSIASGLALRDSDIDLYIDLTSSPTIGPNPRSTFNRINSLLYRSKCFSEVIPIRQARVPIIKCKHVSTGFSLDINMSCPNSVHNTNFLRDIVQSDARLHEMMIFLKIWAKQLQLIGHGNMSSYCLITLVIFYLQQPHGRHQPALPSVKRLQKHMPPNVVMGVNYAYDFKAIFRTLPDNVTVLDLVKGFFAFYKQFDFQHTILALYLGTTLPLEEFKSGKFVYPAYENQLRAMTIYGSAPAERLQVERCVCVQDPFCLNHNVAKSITPPFLEYFRKCLFHAHRICTTSTTATNEPLISTNARIYEALLYDIVEQIARTTELENCIGQVMNNNQPIALNYSFTPCRAEMRALAMRSNTAGNETLYRHWVRHYTEAITEIITEIYRLDMQTASPLHSDKHQRLENTDHTRTWLITGSVDMWTGRLHQRSNVPFLEYQRKQTEAFQSQRRQNAAYAVQLSGLLTLKTPADNTAIELVVRQRSTAMALNKKDPLRKFFTMFKCTMQNFNLKEKLQSMTEKAATSNDTVEENGEPVE